MRSSPHNTALYRRKSALALLLFFMLLVAPRAGAQESEGEQEEEIAGLDVAGFNKIIHEESRLVLVNFAADWCLLCRKQKPVLDEVAALKKDKLRLLVIDMEKNPEIAAYFNVDGLPVNILYKKGNMVWIKMGFRDRNQLLDVIALHE